MYGGLSLTAEKAAAEPTKREIRASFIFGGWVLITFQDGDVPWPEIERRGRQRKIQHVTARAANMQQILLAASLQPPCLQTIVANSIVFPSPARPRPEDDGLTVAHIMCHFCHFGHRAMTTSLLCRRLAALSVNQHAAVRTRCYLAAPGGSLPHALQSVLPTRQEQEQQQLLPPRQYQQQQVRAFARRAAAATATDQEEEANSRAVGAPRIKADQIPPAFLRKLPRKPAPSVVRRRVERLRTYVGTERDIRHSPWRMNLVCQFAAGQTVNDALTQLDFCRKRMAPLVKQLIEKTVQEAAEKGGLHPTQLEVAECFATHGTHLKRMKIMGRGRTGIMHHRYTHVRLVLREIDFPLKIALSSSVAGKRKWLELMRTAEVEGEASRLEKEEVDRLEREIEQRRLDKEKEAAAKEGK